MKKIITVAYLLFSFCSNAQTYTGAGGAILNNGQETYFSLNISGLSPAQIDSTFGLEQVCFNITHPDVSEIDVYLQSPNGIRVSLTLASSSSGANFVNTCVSNQAATSITLGTAPYTGSYKPVGYLGRFNTGQAGNGTWNLIVHDGIPTGNSGNLISWNLQFGNNPAHPVVFNSSNLPLVFINTTQAITTLTTSVTMGIVDNGSARNNKTDPWNSYNAKADINIRGSSSANFEKKSYSIQTMDMSGNKLNGPILGMPVESDWDIVAPYQDKSLLRIPLTYDLFRAMGHYAPRYREVEMFLNNEYQGLYALMEKPKRDSNRIHVKKIAPSDNSWPAVSGGYVIKIDRNDVPGWSSLFPGVSTTGTHFFYQYDYPKASDITIQQQNYIKSYVDSFETVMNGPSFADTLTGYRKYIAVNSFVDFFIINELSKNLDAYRLSTYMYKKDISKGGQLHIGPVWDYDIAWHNCSFDVSYTGWQYTNPDNTSPSPTWWTRFMSDPKFLNELYCRWTELRQNILSISSLNHYIDSSTYVLNESMLRNFTQWPVIGAMIFPNPQNQVGATYTGEVNDLKTWIANRVAWMDGAITGSCSNIGVKENIAANNLVVYPNPMESSTTFSLHLAKRTDISLCITNVLGKEVARYLNTDAPSGDSKIIFERNQIPAGAYFYQLQIDKSVRTGKLIVQ
jgi:subtilisin-like proprotein convertase family protein